MGPAAAPLLALFALLPQQGAVASAEEHATRAGIEMLEAGGNAVDAAVAVGFTLAVTYPLAGNLGGGGFLLYRAPAGEAAFLDFREVAPAAASPELYRKEDGSVDSGNLLRGWRAVAVPGSVPGMLAALERWGRLDREQVLAPAIRLAEEGFLLTARDGDDLRGSAQALRADPRVRSLFFHAGGTPLCAGERLVQPVLAETLRRVAAEGERAFRVGPIVEGVLSASQAGGGVLAAEDFRDYQPVLRPVQSFEWKGLEVLAASAPSSGGLFLQQTLQSLEGKPLRGWDDPGTVLLIGEAEAYAFADRNRWLGDPAGFDFDPAALVSPEYLRERRSRLSTRRYTPPQRVGAGAAAAEGGDTTHYSVIDAEGGACSVTTTLNGAFGAKVMAPGGFLMNNEMDDFAAAPGTPNQFGLVQSHYNAIAPGRRPLSSMSPVIVVREGRVDAVLGSPGGPRILSSVLQVLLNRYQFRMSPRAAVRAPRFHRQDRPPTLQYEEGRLDLAAINRLRALGQPLGRRAAVGAVQAVFRLSNGDLVAVGDPRREGVGLVTAAAPAAAE